MARATKTTARSATRKANRASKANAPAKRERKPKIEHECLCATLTGENAKGEPVYESCGQMTTNAFKPGHDARLKGALIKAYRGGYQLHLNGRHLDPMDVASERGWEHFLKHELKPRPKRERKSSAKAGFNPVTVKIGRATYDAVISNDVDDDHVEVAYQDRSGKSKTKVVLRSAVTEAA